MSVTRHGAEISDGLATRTLSEISELETTRLTVDLVSAARRNIGFLRAVNESQLLDHERRASVLEAIRRYDELWMPLISDLTMVGSKPPVVLPPLDVEWVWFCHTLNPMSYRRYCEARFSKMIGKPAIFDEENKEYALMRCEKQWKRRYPNEAFDNQVVDSNLGDPVVKNEEILNEVMKQRDLYSKLFSWPYMTEIVYLIAARQRYKGFLYVLHRFTDNNGCSRLVPSLDVLLMWVTHQSYPTVYAKDMKEMEADMAKLEGLWDSTVREKEVDGTKKLWEKAFDQPYEKAGGAIEFNSSKPPVYWDVSHTDVNTKYKSMLPRFLLEVCLFVRLNSRMKTMQESIKLNFLRLKVVRCHTELKIDRPISGFSLDSWEKASHLYCEFGTRGLILELRKHGSGCFKRSKLEDTATFLWNDLLRAPSLTMERELDKQVRAVASITPPVQAPYLLKCVPDKVTDDSGAMISDVILRMNHYKPQEGRWLSRTVLDHAGRECFVLRMRIGGGFWRRGGENPSAVKWEDRIIEIREGSWSYVAGSIGRAPEKVVGTATPKEPPEHWQAAWHFSTGEELLISCESAKPMLDLRFCLRNQMSSESSVKLLKGRKMQYRARNTSSASKEQEKQNKEENKQENEEEEEEGFVTLVQFTEDNPTGRATALLNWKLMIVELLPEEDAAFLLLLCISILRSVSEMRKEDVGSLLIRRRLKEARFGAKDWGSVMLNPSSFSSSMSSPCLQPWFWNAKSVVSSDRGDNVTKQPAFSYSPVEGGDKLYKRGIIT